MQCCCGLGGPATVAVVAVDVVAGAALQTAGWRPVRPPALLCSALHGDTNTLPDSAARSKHHAARASPRTRRYPDTQHVSAGQHTTQHVSTCQHNGAATCRLLLGGVAPEVLRALVLAGAALPVGRAGGVRHSGAARAARACWPGHWLSCSEQRWCQVRGGHWSLGDTVSPVSALCSPPDVWSHSGAGAVSPALVRPQPSPAQPCPTQGDNSHVGPLAGAPSPLLGPARPAARPARPHRAAAAAPPPPASWRKFALLLVGWAHGGGRGGGVHRSPALGELSIGQCRQPMVESFLKNVKPKPRPREQCGRPSPAPPPLRADCAPVLCKLWLASRTCVQCRAVWGTLSRHHEKICFATVFIPSNNPSQSHPEYFATCQIFN